MDDLMQNSVKNTISNEEIDSLSLSKIASDMKKQALKAAKWFILIAILFGLFNLIFFITAFLSYLGTESQNHLIYLISSLIVGLGLTILAFYFTYRFILIDTLSIAYDYLTSFFRKLSFVIINKVISKTMDYSSDKNIQNSLNIGNVLLSVYGKNVPNLLQRAIFSLLKRIPFTQFIFNMKSEFEEKKTDKLSDLLYNQIDQYIKQSIFLGNNQKWIGWVLPLNIIIQFILINLI